MKLTPFYFKQFNLDILQSNKFPLSTLNYSADQDTTNIWKYGLEE